MAISNYTELQTAVTDWMERSALSGKAPDFIQMAESEIRRKFNGSAFTADATLTGVVDQDYLGASEGFPTDYERAISLYLTTYGTEDELSPFMNGSGARGLTAGVPQGWSIETDGSSTKRVVLDRPCNSPHTFRFLYRQKLDIATSTTNWLLTNHPDVYLTGSLHWASMYTYQGRVNEGALAWKPAFEAALSEIEVAESADDNLGQARLDPALYSRGAFNINSGD